ncbi:MAG: LLM class flavin-dependent oxidoreductase [Veillonella sp.]|uniref:LLM class flavin-dependent oxidoreductase n=1 Tax=Veillonella sp. TaxID=1926307 RepID=UPI0025E43C9C|nr:LLM class flavin-dependent oxidoreductase [Veillonella sp.]MBS4914187.1 LLM class flavin-dependent oxidoreductase [Veillonella sp.]
MEINKQDTQAPLKVSILNLVPLRAGQTYSEAYNDMIALAQAVESYGYERYWIAEHHNMRSLGSSATQLLIQHTLANTKTIRVGSGGVMLPNQSPYLVAEQYGTLETLYPNRLDLGLGRAPGTDQVTARALRRTHNLYTDFAAELSELKGYFDDTNGVHAYPAAGLQVPFYILGSSTDSAYLAADLGLPYSFASHFAPAMMEEAVAIYRDRFKPSDVLSKPYVILGVNAVLADTDEEAKRLATTHTQRFIDIVTGNNQGLQPPVESEDELWDNYVAAKAAPHFGPISFRAEDIAFREQAVVRQMTAVSLVGSPATAAKQLQELQKRVTFDEIMAQSLIYDQKAQAYSYKLLADAVKLV